MLGFKLLKIYQANYAEMSNVQFTDVLLTILSVSIDLDEKYLMQSLTVMH